MTREPASAVVIGAGVSGLTTAICLAEAGWAVRVWAAEPPRRTTSVVASALWGPSFQEPMAKTLAWTEVSLAAFRELADQPGSGVRLATILGVGDAPPSGAELPPQVAMIPDLRSCPTDELPDGFESGSLSTMPLIDMPRYLDHLAGRLARTGGDIEIRRVDALDEATDAAPVVVNCAGLGARELADDPSVRPVRGQHVILRNPGIENGFMELSTASEWTGFYPHPDRVVCGGSSAPDSWDTAVDEELSERIVARCRRVEPRLEDAEVIRSEVGLRPDRPVVRVEAERHGTARVVHNYGHGGSGISLSWGCAREVTELASGDSR